jgi:MFS family permease
VDILSWGSQTVLFLPLSLLAFTLPPPSTPNLPQTLTAYVADISPDPKTRTKYFGYTTASFSLCLVVAPLVGGFLAKYNLVYPIIAGM